MEGRPPCSQNDVSYRELADRNEMTRSARCQWWVRMTENSHSTGCQHHYILRMDIARLDSTCESTSTVALRGSTIVAIGHPPVPRSEIHLSRGAYWRAKI